MNDMWSPKDSKDFNGVVGTCGDCGSEVLDFCCNDDLVKHRVGAEEWDWWVMCSNPKCKKYYGEGVFQYDVEWMKRS